MKIKNPRDDNIYENIIFLNLQLVLNIVQISGLNSEYIFDTTKKIISIKILKKYE